MTSPDNHQLATGVNDAIERPESNVASRRVKTPRRSHAQRIVVATVAFGGVFGALLRYWLSETFPTKTGTFPWTTFVINVTGSAILGFLLIMLLEQFPNGRLARPLIGSGFLGAYTTFSTYMVEAVLLVRDHHVVMAVTYVLVSLTVGMLAVWLGITGARLAVRAEHWLQKEIR